MKVKVSDLRYCNVLPSRLLSELSKKQLTGITFLNTFYSRVRKWWESERHIELTFDEPGSIAPQINSTCGACGLCCKDIPTHQIGIYMTPHENAKAHGLFPERDIIKGHIEVQGVLFGVVDVKTNGDCTMLGPKGCELGDNRPLWCKIYHCEKFQGQPYQFEVKK